MQISTEVINFQDINPEQAGKLAQRLHIKKDEIKFIRKFYTSEKIESSEDERAVTAIVSTADRDRDGEIVSPRGIELDGYLKNPVLLWAHRYMDPPIGRAMWVKRKKDGLVAKFEFSKSQFANEIYQLYKDGFLRAFSIGFIPLDYDEKEKVHKKILLLEVSAVPVPANENALVVEAYRKGLIQSVQLKKDLALEDIDLESIKTEENEEEEIVIDADTKPETTENYHRIPVDDPDKHKGHKIRTITVSAKKGIKALYCVDCKKIITYLFDKDKWTMEEARRWVDEHKGLLGRYEEKLNRSEEMEEKTIVEIDGIYQELNPDELDQTGEEEEIKLEDEFEIEDVELEEKGVIPFKATPKAPEDTPWDGPKETAKADVKDLKVMCAWYDSEKPDIKQSYKFPHHRAGDHYVVWNGVKAAMGSLFGARRKPKIPEEDRKGVYNHLAKHYKQFDKEVPEFREYTEAELKAMFPELYEEKTENPEEKLMEIANIIREQYEKIIAEKDERISELKEGRVLSKKNRAIIKKAIEALQEVLAADKRENEDSGKDDGKEIDIENIKTEQEANAKDVEMIIEKKLKDLLGSIDIGKVVSDAIDQKIKRLQGKLE